MTDRTAIKIEKNIPIPTVRAKYPWDEMEVGDSFFVPGMKASQFGGAMKTPKQRGWQMISRKENGGIRVWRVA